MDHPGDSIREVRPPSRYWICQVRENPDWIPPLDLSAVSRNLGKAYLVADVDSVFRSLVARHTHAAPDYDPLSADRVCPARVAASHAAGLAFGVPASASLVVAGPDVLVLAFPDLSALALCGSHTAPASEREPLATGRRASQSPTITIRFFFFLLTA